MTSLRPILPLLFGLLISTAAAGQESPQRQLTLRNLAFQIRGTLPDLYLHDLEAPAGTPGVRVSLKGYLNHERETVALSGATAAFTTSPDPASLKDPKNVIAKLRVPANLREAVLLFVPAPEGHPEPLRILPIDDSRKAFPSGSINVLNLSPELVRITLEKSGYEFTPGETELIEDPPTGDNQMSQMTAFKKEGESWQRLASSNWMHPGPARSLQIIFANPRSKRLEMREIKDIALPDEP